MRFPLREGVPGARDWGTRARGSLSLPRDPAGADRSVGGAAQARARAWRKAAGDGRQTAFVYGCAAAHVLDVHDAVPDGPRATALPGSVRSRGMARRRLRGSRSSIVNTLEGKTS